MFSDEKDNVNNIFYNLDKDDSCIDALTSVVLQKEEQYYWCCLRVCGEEIQEP